MDFNLNQHHLSSDRLLLLSTCMNQSRTTLLENQEDLLQNHQILGQTENIPQTRKFKLEIEQKYANSNHNHKYFFPRNICFRDGNSQQQQMLKSLTKVRFYNLSSQNNSQQEILQKLKKSRSELTTGLFRQALQAQKQQSRHVSKNKGRQKTSTLPIKPKHVFKKLAKDKENNLNFQNLKDQRQSKQKQIYLNKSINKSISKSISKSQNKLSSPSVGKSNNKYRKINIPKINISDHNQQHQVKCFKDLAKLDRR